MCTNSLCDIRIKGNTNFVFSPTSMITLIHTQVQLYSSKHQSIHVITKIFGGNLLQYSKIPLWICNSLIAIKQYWVLMCTVYNLQTSQQSIFYLTLCLGDSWQVIYLVSPTSAALRSPLTCFTEHFQVLTFSMKGDNPPKTHQY